MDAFRLRYIDGGVHLLHCRLNIADAFCLVCLISPRDDPA
jgi:hypothetical protein